MQKRHETIHGRWCLWDGIPMLLTSPLRYLLLVVLLPAAAAAAIAAAIATPTAAAITFVGGIVFMWLFQFLFFR